MALRCGVFRGRGLRYLSPLCVNPTTDGALHAVYRCHGVDSRLLEVCLAVDLARIGAGTRNAMGSLWLDS